MAGTQLERILGRIEYLLNTKSDIADAISQHVDKNGNYIKVSDEDTFRDYAKLIQKIHVGNNKETQDLDVSENGSYTPDDGYLFNPVYVNVESNVGSLDISENGTYNAADEGLDGYDSISISVDTDDDSTSTDTDDSDDTTTTEKDDADLKLDSGEFIQNGVYYASEQATDDKDTNPLDGWDTIYVNVPEEAQVATEDLTFTVKYYNGTKLLYTDTVAAGEESVYAGPTVTRNGLYFTGWEPVPTNVKDDLEVHAQFTNKKPTGKLITDTWDVILTNRGRGYSVGSYKPLEIEGYGTIRMQKVAAYDWIAMDPLDVQMRYSQYKQTSYTDNSDGSHTPNPTEENEGKPYVGKLANSNASIWPYNPHGWRTSGLRAILNSDVYNAIPANVRAKIKPSTKYSKTYETEQGDQYAFSEKSQDLIWIPSHKELFGDTSDYKEGGVNFSLFTSDASRIMANKAGNQNVQYPLRSMYGSGGSTTGGVSNQGKFVSVSVETAQYIRIGFTV